MNASTGTKPEGKNERPFTLRSFMKGSEGQSCVGAVQKHQESNKQMKYLPLFLQRGAKLVHSLFLCTGERKQLYAIW
jgi:hypothetical protein